MEGSQPDRERTVVCTYRMPVSVIHRLKQEARDRRLTSNALMNQIVGNYFDFYNVAANVGMMPLSKRLIKEMVDLLNTDDLAKLAKLVGELDLPDLAYMKRNKFTLETFLECFLDWIKFCGFPYKYSSEDGRRTISIEHNMGIRWSEFLSEILEVSFGKLNVRVSIKRLDDILVAVLENEHSR